MRFPVHTLILPLALLSGCSDNSDEAPEGKAVDATSQEALNEDLMTDPDLAGSSQANAALSASGDRSLPDINRSQEAISAARKRAAEMVGGTDALRPVPAPRDLGNAEPVTPAMQEAAVAAVRPGGNNCQESIEYTTSWAAKLPKAFPVYPRANTLEAAGTDEGACALRVVTFLTPVRIDEVLAFYHTRALSNGYSAEHVKGAGDNILSGTKGQSAYVVYARQRDNGVTEVDLVTSAR